MTARHVQAGAQRVDTRRQLYGRPLWRPEPASWQPRAWTFFDGNGDLHRGYSIKANTIAKVRIYGAWQPSPDDEPVPFDEALANPDIDTTGLTEQTAELAEQTVARISARDGGPQEIQRLLALNLDVPGEGWLLGRDDGGQEHWSVHSVEQIVWQDGYVLYELPGAGGTRGTGTPIGPDDVLIRIWRKHPRFPMAADSAFRALLPDLEQQDLLRKSISSSLTNRITQNGLLIVDSNIDLPGSADQRGETNTADGVYEAILEAASTAIRDQSLAAAHVPVVVQVEGASDRKISEAMHHFTLDKPMHESNVRYMVDLGKQIRNGADFPPEWATGIGDTSTYANARQVGADGYSQDVDPTVLLICAAYTSAWVHPVLEEAGVPPEVVSRCVAWRDPDTVITKPDRAKYAEAVAKMPSPILSPEAMRAAMGFDEGDAPDPAMTPQVQDVAAPADDVAEDEGPNAGELGGMTASAPAVLALTAAAPTQARLDRLSSRLASIDTRLTSRLHVAADRAVADGLSRAGLQVKAKAQGSAALKRKLAGVPPHKIIAALSEEQRFALAVDDQALVDGALSGLHNQYQSWTAQAQAQARRSASTVGAWPDSLEAEVEAAQDDDRDAGWAWLAAALLAVMTQRLTAPDVIAPERGEWDVTATVPWAATRAAVAVAGGADLDAQAAAQGKVLTASFVPAGGVGDGPVILSALYEAANVTTGAYVWTVGAPTTPFPPHHDLDGQVFTQWDDPVLASDGDWPDVEFYFPGDHQTCVCAAENVLVVE